jgi:hypothetical protein
VAPLVVLCVSNDLQLQQRKAECRVGVYVRVHGHLRAFGGEKSIYAFNIRPVKDYNEVSGPGAGQSGCEVQGVPSASTRFLF